MYARTVKGRELNFAVSGMLWRRSLVMVDEETQSLWSHLLGEGMRGEMKGVTLPTLPGVITTWKAWKTDHPDTSVLSMSRTAREFVKDFHAQPGRFVLGLRTDEAATAYPFELLMEEGVVNDDFAGEPVAVFFDREGTGGRAFSRRLDEQTLTFKQEDGQLTDQETKSRWDARGTAVEGELKGKVLREIPAIPSFRRAWKVFYPQTRVYGGRKVN